MTFTAHIAAGIILVKYLELKGLLNPSLEHQYLLVASIASTLPDLDGLIFHKIYDHRTNSPFHIPATWWILCLTAVVVAVAQRQRIYLSFIYVSFLSIYLHLFLDTFGVNAGICWLKPFTRKEYSFLPIHHGKPTNIREWILNYWKSPLIVPEVVITLSGLILLIKSF